MITPSTSEESSDCLIQGNPPHYQVNKLWEEPSHSETIKTQTKEIQSEQGSTSPNIALPITSIPPSTKNSPSITPISPTIVQSADCMSLDNDMVKTEEITDD